MKRGHVKTRLWTNFGLENKGFGLATEGLDATSRCTMLSFLVILAVLPTASSTFSAFGQALRPGSESKGEDVESALTRREDDANQRRAHLPKVLRAPTIERKDPNTQILVQLVEGVANDDKPAKFDSAAEAKVKLSSQVEKFLKWLPVDTETFILAHDVSLRMPTRSAEGDDRVKSNADGFQSKRTRDLVYVLKSLSLGHFRTLGGGNMLQNGSYIKRLENIRVPLTVYGGRNYEVVSSFGSYRYEGCSIMAFKEDIATTGKEYLQALRRDAKQVRQIGGREVFVFPADKNEMESIYKLKPWQGVYVTVLSPNVILTATSDAYLKELLDRVDAPTKDRALPDSLPEWSYVDTTSRTWGLRHIPPVKNQKLNGLVWMCQPGKRDALEIVYFPTASDDAIKPAKQWFGIPIANGEDTKLPSGAIKFGKDKTTYVTLKFDQLQNRTWVPIFPIYGLQGYYGTW